MQNHGRHSTDTSEISVTNVRHTGIVVSDMGRSLPFYRDLLGMEVWADFRDSSPYAQAVTRVPDANIWMIKLKAQDGVSIELLQYLSHPQAGPAPRRACDVGINHIALQVDDLDALYERLKAHDIVFHAPPAISPDGGAKVTYCRDPEGVIIELVEILQKSPEPPSRL
jgi:catechol 2,3-dioxygenase-like lactoylglutathione lyase family enzyme